MSSNKNKINIIGGLLNLSPGNCKINTFYTEAYEDFSIKASGLCYSGTYSLWIQKMIVNDITITLPNNATNQNGETTLVLSGDKDSWFLVEILYNGTITIFTLVGSSLIKPGTKSKFSANVVPYINGNNEWAESNNFKYQNNTLSVPKVETVFEEYPIDLSDVFSLKIFAPYDMKLNISDQNNGVTLNVYINQSPTAYVWGDDIDQWDEIEFVSAGSTKAIVEFEKR